MVRESGKLRWEIKKEDMCGWERNIEMRKKWIDMGEREEINEKKIVSISPATQLLTSIISTKFDVK